MAKKEHWQKIGIANLPPIGKQIFLGTRLRGEWRTAGCVSSDRAQYEHFINNGWTHWAETPLWFLDGPSSARAKGVEP